VPLAAFALVSAGLALFCCYWINQGEEKDELKKARLRRRSALYDLEMDFHGENGDANEGEEGEDESSLNSDQEEEDEENKHRPKVIRRRMSDAKKANGSAKAEKTIPQLKVNGLGAVAASRISNGVANGHTLGAPPPSPPAAPPGSPKEGDPPTWNGGGAYQASVRRLLTMPEMKSEPVAEVGRGRPASAFFLSNSRPGSAAPQARELLQPKVSYSFMHVIQPLRFHRRGP